MHHRTEGRRPRAVGCDGFGHRPSRVWSAQMQAPSTSIISSSQNRSLGSRLRVVDEERPGYFIRPPENSGNLNPQSRRTREELEAENASLRQQVILLSQGGKKKPAIRRFAPSDHLTKGRGADPSLPVRIRSRSPTRRTPPQTTLPSGCSTRRQSL